MRKTWALLPLALLFAAGCEVKDETPQQPTPTTSVAVSVPENTTIITAETTTTSVPQVKESIGQKNARKSAESYLKSGDFSAVSLANQLEYEGFSADDINYAITTVKVDWNIEAAESATSYLSTSSFSRESLTNQLEYEGFTADQIQFALTAVGY